MSDLLPRSHSHTPAGLTLARLFEAWAGEVRRVLRRAGLDAADSDDGLQQVFLVASRRLGDLLPGQERAFLRGVASRVASRQRGRRAREAAAVTEAPEIEAREELDAQLERRRALVAIETAVAHLDSTLAEVFELTYRSGLSRREVAAVLGLPEGTVASRLRRAHSTLVVELKRRGAPPTLHVECSLTAPSARRRSHRRES